jgi:hypothetical protein
LAASRDLHPGAGAPVRSDPSWHGRAGLFNAADRRLRPGIALLGFHSTAPRRKGAAMRILAILTVRNEAPFLLEWLAHHRAAGITDFLVFSNDCADGSDAMLDRLAKLGQLTHVRTATSGEGGVQWAALNQAARHPMTRAADWIVVLDIDEFLNVHCGDGTVAALIGAVPGATAIALTWRIFGNGGVVRFADRPVLRQFTRTAAEAPLWPQLTQIKTLFRNDGSYAKPGVHRPRRPDPARHDRIVWVDGNGDRLPDFYRDPPPMLGIATDPRRAHYRLAQINHYPLGSMEGFLVKAERGRPNRLNRPIDMTYWVERNMCEAEDRTILRHWPRVAAGIEALMADPELHRLHADGVAWRHARIAQLMLEEAPFALYRCLLVSPPPRPLTPAEAATLIRQLRAGMARRHRRV